MRKFQRLAILTLSSAFVQTAPLARAQTAALNAATPVINTTDHIGGAVRICYGRDTYRRSTRSRLRFRVQTDPVAWKAYDAEALGCEVRMHDFPLSTLSKFEDPRMGSILTYLVALPDSDDLFGFAAKSVGCSSSDPIKTIQNGQGQSWIAIRCAKALTTIQRRLDLHAGQARQFLFLSTLEYVAPPEDVDGGGGCDTDCAP